MAGRKVQQPIPLQLVDHQASTDRGAPGSVGVDATWGEDVRRVRHGQDAVLHEGDLQQVGQQGEGVERADVEQVVLAVPGGGAPCSERRAWRAARQ
ncbi:hypothetical protein [Streptomyces sp. DK15]|uniref:hypothetical protein n=1 Tax=Streptomyces sp. DK15 TaxID=2957499 RepID=UPI0029C049E6|nr:hypothetical protein [Streptomyces sp. DK15]